MESRFKKFFIKNASIAFVLQIINLLVTFVTRTVFVKMLGNDYLSLNGLFTNIVSLLSFAELGIGNAIIFSLYKPIAANDQKKIISLMSLFKKAYKWIRVSILVFGMLIIPFVDDIIKNVEIEEDFVFIFILFLINTYVSYFYAYKKSLLIADQKNYIVSLIQQVTLILQSIIQCVLLYYTYNFVLYLIVQITCTVIINIVTSRYVDFHYEFLKRPGESLGTDEKTFVFSNIKNIFCYKIGAVILNSTDNLLISTLITTQFVGLYSNYSMLISAMNSVLMQVCNSIAATIGNYNVVNSDEKNEETFRNIFFLSFWIFGICTICLAEMLNPFVKIWLGNDFLLEQTTVVIISLVFYITGINQIPSQYRTSFGIFKQAKFVPIIAAILNVIFSIALGKAIGLNGIFIATIIAKVLTFNIVDPILIYIKGFKKRSKKFFLKKFLYFILLIGTFVIIHFLNSLIMGDTVIKFCIKAVLTFFISNAIFILALWKSREFKQIVGGIVNEKNKDCN